ncbi:MAG: PQQ-dependent sugar dehydrogenase [Planctomycetes bacterium]|nr:PQQ-dependent sugar dehydrogenase [Planctomycetota bacterium]
MCASQTLAQSTIRAQRVASGLVNPTFAGSPDGDFQRLFLLEQASGSNGYIRVLDLSQTPPQLQSAPYLSINPILAGGEEGLLGLAFHPNFANNGYFFVYYTNTNGDNQVVRYRANAPFATSTSADPTSANPVMTISHPGASNHNGGWLAFGPDGYLYISTGDGGPGMHSQDLGLRLGKIMRVDPDGDAYPLDRSRNYAIPPGNPFVGTSGALPEIWHLGLRNPWRAAFDRATGDLWIGDVGNASFEEIEFVPAGMSGLNFGWDCMEGFSCTGSGNCNCNDPAHTLPVHAYAHTSGNCSIIGGSRYRGSSLCNFQGLYFFGDFCSGRVWTVGWNGSGVQNLTERTAELNAGGGPAISLLTAFGEDAAGELYICDALGDVFKIVGGNLVDCNANGVQDACDLASGASHDWNSDGVLDECQLAGTPGCFGDGTSATACPCGNNGAAGRGCQNSITSGGAKLQGFGLPGADSLVLLSSGELPVATTIFLQGNTLIPSGQVFGDGVRCAGGTLKRLYAKPASGGTVHAPLAGDLSITARSTQLGDPIAPQSGQVRYYQAYYRDPNAGFCPAPSGSTWNVSNMLTITW